MNWDWEKLKEQQEHKSKGPIPPQMGNLMEKLKGLIRKEQFCPTWLGMFFNPFYIAKNLNSVFSK